MNMGAELYLNLLKKEERNRPGQARAEDLLCLCNCRRDRGNSTVPRPGGKDPSDGSCCDRPTEGGKRAIAYGDGLTQHA